MTKYQVHVYREFSQVVDVEADSIEDAIDAGIDGTSFGNWEESGDEYVSSVTINGGATEVWSMMTPATEPTD